MPDEMFIIAAVALGFVVVSTLAAMYFTGRLPKGVRSAKPRKKAPLPAGRTP
jgi:hypothetical protein